MHLEFPTLEGIRLRLVHGKDACRPHAKRPLRTVALELSSALQSSRTDGSERRAIWDNCVARDELGQIVDERRPPEKADPARVRPNSTLEHRWDGVESELVVLDGRVRSCRVLDRTDVGEAIGQFRRTRCARRLRYGDFAVQRDDQATESKLAPLFNL